MNNKNQLFLQCLFMKLFLQDAAKDFDLNAKSKNICIFLFEWALEIPEMSVPGV